MKRILLIEDNLEIRENTTEILELAGYQMISAANGKAGVDLAQKEKPDLIICDIMMPELDGYGVLHILNKRSETAGIPFIFLTAKTEKTDIRKGMNLGADDYLTKPFDDTDLLNAIDARFKKSSMQQKLYERTPQGLNNFIEDARKVLNLQSLCENKRIKSIKKKVTVYTEGDTPTNLFFIKSGSVKVFKSNDAGKELITNIYHQNDFFGFEPLLEGVFYNESASATQDTEVIVIPKDDFTRLLQSHPDVAAAFISFLSKKVEAKEKQLLNLAYNSVRQRTAEALLKVQPLAAQKEVIRISREDLASMVGTATESVIRVLSDFRDEGLIEIESGKIKILNSVNLEKVVRWNVVRKDH